ncbi:Carbonic anhydrase [Penicillium macrosclerotiorum]|uniref:Carbonic anhydrase n=1 Tax=Penicillium macrosclerotiorum TaxID=303699 RepID=UPI00254987A3|nr:Carbonic anhydrase [Penicillium macrosclerotiorum]KAJ5679319.1 Carbonic anhydrase [Penicillium macrosclerotiorum]
MNVSGFAVRPCLRRTAHTAGLASKLAGRQQSAVPSLPTAASCRRAPFSMSAPVLCATPKTPGTPPPAQANSSDSSIDKYTAGLRQNKEWASQTARENPELFPTLATGQQPQILWLGCSDSRCPETSMLGLQPGDVFVHRNIANILHAGDLSSGAVIEYAVKHLRVKHIVVCGHTSCGGVAAAMGNKQLGILDPWLLPLRQVRERNLSLLQSLSTEEAALKLVELNVREGLNVVTQKDVVLSAIQERGLQVHGLIYDVASGVLRELDTSDSEDAIRARLVAFKTEA